MSVSETGAAVIAPTMAQITVFGRISEIVRRAEQDIVHDEKALVAWVKAELAKL
jgi:hypothetical protein